MTEIKNAKIIAADIQLEPTLTVYINFQLEHNIVQALPFFNLHRGMGFFIKKLMEVADVNYFSDLVEKPVRLHTTSLTIISIGHYLDDLWFMPERELENLNEI